MRHCFFISVLLMLSSLSITAQDSVLTFQKAKERLVEVNLELLAAYYDVNIAKAQVIQARVWSNPYFTFNGDLYAHETNEYFHFRNQHLLQVTQTISIAGRRVNAIKLANVGVEISEKQLEDVLRALMFELGVTYNSMAALQAKQVLYQQVLASYENLMSSIKTQLEVGGISLAEALRIETEYLAVKAEAVANNNDYELASSELRILLRYPGDVAITLEQNLPLVVENLDTEDLISKALESRPDVQLSKLERDYAERNLKLQRSIGVPGLDLGYQPRDRGSNYVRPYSGFNIELSLPLFDRNQAQVQTAKFEIEKSKLEVSKIDNQVRNEVTAAYNRYSTTGNNLKNYNGDFLEKVKTLNENSYDNFRKRNISLLQMIDNQRIYMLTNIQHIELKQQHMDQISELNFHVGTNIIEY